MKLWVFLFNWVKRSEALESVIRVLGNYSHLCCRLGCETILTSVRMFVWKSWKIQMWWAAASTWFSIRHQRLLVMGRTQCCRLPVLTKKSEEASLNLLMTPLPFQPGFYSSGFILKVLLSSMFGICYCVSLPCSAGQTCERLYFNTLFSFFWLTEK